MMMRDMVAVIVLGVMVLMAASVDHVESRTKNSNIKGFAITGIGTDCEEACNALISGEATSPIPCTACYAQNGLLNAFYEDPAPVQRLPVREAGFVSSPAYPIINLNAFYTPVGFGPDAPFIVDIFDRTLSFLNGYDTDALIDVESGERLPMSTGVTPTLCNLSSSNGTDAGLFGSVFGDPRFRQVANLDSCSDEPGTAPWVPRGDIGFTSVSEYATASAKNLAIECLADNLEFQEGVAQRLMDVDDPDTMARELFWSIGTPGVATPTPANFKNASTYSDAKWESIRACHTADDDSSVMALDQDQLQALKDAGRLLVYDLSHFETLSKFQIEGRPAGKSFGSQAFFEVEDALVDGRRSVVALAICLSSLDDDTGERSVRVYTPALSPSAFALAAWHLSANVQNYFVFVAHVNDLHRRDAVMTYAALNTIDPDVPLGNSTHPLRQLIDAFSDPIYNLSFLTNIVSFWTSSLHQLYVNEDNMVPLLDDYAAGRFDPYGDERPNTSWNTVRTFIVSLQFLSVLRSFMWIAYNLLRPDETLTRVAACTCLSVHRVIRSRWLRSASVSIQTSGVERISRYSPY